MKEQARREEEEKKRLFLTSVFVKEQNPDVKKVFSIRSTKKQVEVEF